MGKMRYRSEENRVAAANVEFWTHVAADEEYRQWMIECCERLIRVCERPDRVAGLERKLKRLEEAIVKAPQVDALLSLSQKLHGIP